MLTSQFLPGRGLTIYFPRRCLRVQLFISLNLGADRDRHLWVTDWSLHALNYWEALRTKKVDQKIIKV